jgi:hypothetical protein
MIFAMLQHASIVGPDARQQQPDNYGFIHREESAIRLER